LARNLLKNSLKGGENDSKNINLKVIIKWLGI